MSENYTATIGLEVHAELKTKSKMFCACSNNPHEAEPNSLICPVCLAHPGTLPVANEEAIAKVLLFGQAVKAKKADFSEFDRKNYFYPDIPKAYQISQYAYPFLTEGSLCGVDLTRVHLEEDTARSQHDHDGVSLVDFNRAGVPLMELVTEPVIHDSKTAGDFARELQLLLQTLDISNAQMERGEMRVEANISISNNETLGTKVEVKNLNSFRSVESAIAYEIERQRTVLERGGVVHQETRGWDEVKLKTYKQRSKESAKDYRYFPDPDLPKLKVSEYGYFSETRLAEILPELPEKKREKYSVIGIPSNQVELIISTKVIDEIFSKIYLDSSSNKELIKLSANYLTSDVLSELSTKSSKNMNLSVESFCKLMMLVDKKSINSRIAKDLLKELMETDFDPEVVVKERGLLQSSDSSTVQLVVDEVINEFAAIAEEYRSGKISVLQFLVGQGMKKTKGTANPTLLMDLFKKTLDK